MKSLSCCFAFLANFMIASVGYCVPTTTNLESVSAPLLPQPPTFGFFRIDDSTVSPSSLVIPLRGFIDIPGFPEFGAKFAATIDYTAGFRSGLQPGLSSDVRLVGYNLVLNEVDGQIGKPIGTAQASPNAVFDNVDEAGSTGTIFIEFPVVSASTLNSQCNFGCDSVAGRADEMSFLEFALDRQASFIDVRFDQLNINTLTRYFLDGRTQLVPEPSTLILFLPSLLLITFFRRRRTSS